MATENSKSRMRSARIPLADDEHLTKKAIANPNNRNNHIASEINDLIAADRDRTKLTGKFHFRKK